MRLFAKAFAVVAAAFAVAGGPVAAQDTLRAGTECTYFPFNYKDSDGTLKGYDVDVGNEIGKRLNMKVEWVCQKWDGMLPALLANKYDVILASLSITEERRQKIDFSVSYRVSIGQFVGPKAKALKLFKDDKTPDIAAFKGVKIGIQRGTTYDNWIAAKVPDATVVKYDTVEQTYLELRSGRVDVIMTNPMKTYLEFLSKPDGAGFEVIGPQIDEEKYFGTGAGVGLRKGEEALLKKIDAALVGMKKDGTLEKFSKVYFPFAIYPTN